MHLLVLGATGRVGRHLLAHALADGHTVTALVRQADKLKLADERLTIIEGDACVQHDVQRAMRGADVVLSSLSTDGGTVLTDSMPLIAAAMQEEGVKRIVTVGTAGILQSRECPGLLRYESSESRRSSTRAAEEHRKAWELLAASGLDWTVVCPTYLPDGVHTGQYRAERDFLPEGGLSISVPDTAAFTYRQLFTRDYVGSRVGLAY